MHACIIGCDLPTVHPRGQLAESAEWRTIGSRTEPPCSSTLYVSFAELMFDVGGEETCMQNKSWHWIVENLSCRMISDRARCLTQIRLTYVKGDSSCQLGGQARTRVQIPTKRCRVVCLDSDGRCYWTVDLEDHATF